MREFTVNTHPRTDEAGTRMKTFPIVNDFFFLSLISFENLYALDFHRKFFSVRFFFAPSVKAF